VNLNPTRRSGHTTWTGPSVVSLTEAIRLAEHGFGPLDGPVHR